MSDNNPRSTSDRTTTKRGDMTRRVQRRVVVRQASSAPARPDDDMDAVLEDEDFKPRTFPEPPQMITYLIVIGFTILAIATVIGGLIGRFPPELVGAVLAVYAVVIPLVARHYYRRSGRN